jgi:hypothetical protein
MGRFPELPITKEDYQHYKAAKSCLSSALQIEILYDALVTSYIEWESTMLSEAIRYTVYSNNSYIDSVYTQTLMMRRLVTILSLSRQYQDQVKKHVKRIKDASAKESVDTIFEKEELTSLEYQTIYYLRNVAQHANLTPDSFQTCQKAEEKNGARWIITTIDPYISKSKITDSSDVKRPKDFKALIAKMPDKIPIKPYIRTYMECTSRIQDSIRKLITDEVSGSRRLMDEATVKYASHNNGNTLGLSACRKAPNGTLPDHVDLCLNWDDARIAIQERNQTLNSLSKQYASGENTLTAKK